MIAMSFVGILVSVLLVLGVSQLDGSSDNVSTVILAVTPSIILMIALLAGRIRDVFHPLALFTYLVFFSVTLKTFFLLYLDPEGISAYLSLGVYGLDVLDDGLVLTIYACLALLVGYAIAAAVPRRRHENVRLGAMSPRAMTVAMVVSWVVSTIAILLFLRGTGALSEIMAGRIFAKRFAEVDGQQIVASFGYLRLLGVTLPQLMLISLLSQRFRFGYSFEGFQRFLLVALTINAVAIPLLASSRLELAYLILFLLFAYHYLKKRIRLQWIAVFGLVILSLMAVLGEARRVQSQRFETEYQFALFDIVRDTLGRAYFMDIGKTSGIVAAVPDDVPYLNGSSMLKLFIAPIPRSLWPDKPIVALNTYVSNEVLGRIDESGVPPGIVGELYLNRGTPAVLIGVFLIGIFLNVLYRSIRGPGSSPELMIVLLAITMFTLFTIELTNYVVAALRYLFVYAIFILPFKMRPSRAEATDGSPPLRQAAVTAGGGR